MAGSNVPWPARVLITREGGRTERASVPVGVWLSGAREHTLRVAASPRIVSVEIDPEQWFPDIDRSNDTWRR